MFAQRKTSWPKQSAIVISNTPNMHMMLRELIRGFGWTVTEATTSVELAVSTIQQGLAHLLIVDDNVDLPALSVMRYLLNDATTCLTPTLCFVQESNKAEIPALQRIGRPELTDKPLTPSKFLPAFTKLVKRWESSPWINMRQAVYQANNGNLATSIKSLIAATENNVVQSLAAVSLAHTFRSLGKLKQAETILLGGLKRSPRDLGLMVAIGDFYMHAGLPKMAHRFFAGARNAFPQSMAAIPDLIQANILLGNLDDAIIHLYSMYKQGYIHPIQDYLARVLFAEGRDEEAERVLHNNKSIFARLQASWLNAESQNINLAAG